MMGDQGPRVLGDVKAGARMLRVARAYTGMSQREVAETAHGDILSQQISRFEKGLVEKPAAADLGVLARIYDVTPNEMFEWFNYWTPRKAEEAPEHPDPRVRAFLSSYRRLPEDAREELLSWLEFATRTAQAKAAAALVESEAEEADVTQR